MAWVDILFLFPILRKCFQLFTRVWCYQWVCHIWPLLCSGTFPLSAGEFLSLIDVEFYQKLFLLILRWTYGCVKCWVDSSRVDYRLRKSLSILSADAWDCVPSLMHPSTGATGCSVAPGLVVKMWPPGELILMNTPWYLHPQVLVLRVSAICCASPWRPSKTRRYVWPMLPWSHCFFLNPDAHDLSVPSEYGVSIFPVLWSACNQALLAFKGKCSGGSFFWCQTSQAVEPDLGLWILTPVGELLQYIILQFVVTSLGGGGRGLGCDYIVSTHLLPSHCGFFFMSLDVDCLFCLFVWVQSF